MLKSSKFKRKSKLPPRLVGCGSSHFCLYLWVPHYINKQLKQLHAIAFNTSPLAGLQLLNNLQATAHQNGFPIHIVKQLIISFYRIPIRLLAQLFILLCNSQENNTCRLPIKGYVAQLVTVTSQTMATDPAAATTTTKQPLTIKKQPVYNLTYYVHIQTLCNSLQKM